MPHRRPVRLERTRCFTGRLLVRSALIARLAVVVLPKTHPYRHFLATSLSELGELADATCRPRPAPTILHDRPRHMKKAVLLTALALAACDSIAASPVDTGVLPDFHLGIRAALHIREAPQGAHFLQAELPWRSPLERITIRVR